MKNLPFALLSLSLSLFALAGCRPNEAQPVGAEELAIGGLEDDAEASQASLDASELAIGGSAFAFGGDAGCTATVTGADEIAVCSRTVPGTRTVAWSCTAPNGSSVSGAATVVTTVIDDSACPSVAIRHDVSFSRLRAAGDITAELEGTSQVDLVLDSANRTAQRTVALDVTRRVHRNDDLIRDQRLTGERVADLAANAIGPADDTRTVNGNVTVEFLLTDAQLDIGATDLLWRRECCHPVGGRIDWLFSGENEGSGSLRFGPTCGLALRADDSEVTLHPCPNFAN